MDMLFQIAAYVFHEIDCQTLDALLLSQRRIIILSSSSALKSSFQKQINFL